MRAIINMTDVKNIMVGSLVAFYFVMYFLNAFSVIGSVEFMSVDLVKVVVTIATGLSVAFNVCLMIDVLL